MCSVIKSVRGDESFLGRAALGEEFTFTDLCQ